MQPADALTDEITPKESLSRNRYEVPLTKLYFKNKNKTKKTSYHKSETLLY